MVWRLLARTTMALGWVSALVMWGVRGPIACTLAVFVITFLLAVLFGDEEPNLWLSARIGFKVALVLVACTALVTAFGWSGALLVLLVAVTWPVMRLLLLPGSLSVVLRQAISADLPALREDPEPLRGLRTAPEDAAGGPSLSTMVSFAEMPDADGVRTLDDHALCQAWRRSYVRLEASRAAGERLEAVRLRQLYLDELARRHPAEVRHWLASGARAAGNPLPFLNRPVRADAASEEGRPEGYG